MLAALHAHPQARQFRIKVLDVDANEDLVRQYDELVPVLVGVKPDGSKVRICHYFLVQEALNVFLSL
ncbi:glutaredoxin family protein|nr:glutaredoxin family protein [Noviherbaspirillum sp. L7-7A]